MLGTGVCSVNDPTNSVKEVTSSQ